MVSVRKEVGSGGSRPYLKVRGGHGIVSRHGSKGRGWNPCRLASLSLLCLLSNSWRQSRWCLDTDNFKHSIIISNLDFLNLCDDFCSICATLNIKSLLATLVFQTHVMTSVPTVTTYSLCHYMRQMLP